MPSIVSEVTVLETLNPQQRAAVEQMQSFLDSENDNFFLLVGFAGTGKTYTIQALLQQLLAKQKLQIACSAPTHKAVKVIKNMASRWSVDSIDFGTIHQFLGLKLDYDDEGERVLIEGRNSSIKGYNIVILDEASMVSSSLWQLISESAVRHNIKFILMGDPAQLPPVNELESPVFSAVHQQAKLTQVMRQAEDNPIADIIEAARERVFHHNYNLLMHSSYNPDQSQGVWVLERVKWLDQMVKAFQSKRYQDNPDYVRALAWTNRTVDQLNQYIREALYEDASQPYVKRERLVAKDTIFDPIEGEQILINNSAECQVIEALQTREAGYNVWKLHLVDEDGNQHRVKVLDESSYADFDANLKKLAQKARESKRTKANNPWSDYWSLRNRYAQFAYAYAMTCHKAQGSTFTNVFIAQSDILRNSDPVERYKTLYTAFSRASQRLIINL